MRPSPERVDIPYFWVRVTPSGTTTTGSIIPNGTTVPYRYERTWSGTVTPGWHNLKRRAKMKLSVLVHSYRKREATGTPYLEEQYLWNFNGSPYAGGKATYSISNTAAIISMPSATHLSDAYTKARARLAEKVCNMDINLAQAFGERKQTSNLLANTATQIALAMRHLKHGQLRDFSRALSLEGSKVPSAKQWEAVIATPVVDRLSRHWLSFQYGWKPLIQDAFGAADLLAQHSQERYVTKSEANATVAEYTMIPMNHVNQTPEIIQVKKTRVRMASVYCLDDMTKSVLAQTGIANPALLAWELLPWSFVIDWFLPVGNYLQALQAFAGFKFVQGWYSQKTKLERQETYGTVKPKYWNGALWEMDVRRGSAFWSDIVYDRVKLDNFPVVGPLTFKNPIGGAPYERLTTAVALMRQLAVR